MRYRNYNHETDKEAMFRIANEIGWVSKKENFWLNECIPQSRTIVSELNGSVECFVTSILGGYNYNGTRLNLSAVAGVGTGIVARKQRLASRLTASKVALDALDGADVSGLGFFEQGYYNQLGFGNNPYEHMIWFSPSNLKLEREIPVPVRLDLSHATEIHELRINRLQMHGNAYLSEVATKADLQDNENYQGYGFRDDNGMLTHLIWIYGRGREHGPYTTYLIYQTYEQLLDLLALIKSFGDQINIVRIVEPPGIQFQDFLKKPFTYNRITHGSKFQNFSRASCWSQLRIVNLERCVSVMKTVKPVNFNLELSDPISKYIPEEIAWRGVGGEYTIDLSGKSHLKEGFTDGLPTMKATINAFTRLWSGALKATQLSVSDDLEAPKELLEKLDYAINLPQPHYDWDF